MTMRLSVRQRAKVTRTLVSDWLAVPSPTEPVCDLRAAGGVLAVGWIAARTFGWVAAGRALVVLLDVVWIVVLCWLVPAIGGRLRVLPRTQGAWAAIPIVVCGFLLASPVVEWAVKTVADVGPRGTFNDLPGGLERSERWLALILPVALAVVVEELIYRAALPTIVAATGLRWGGAVVVSSLAWGLAHGGFPGG